MPQCLSRWRIRPSAPAGPPAGSGEPPGGDRCGRPAAPVGGGAAPATRRPGARARPSAGPRAAAAAAVVHRRGRPLVRPALGGRQVDRVPGRGLRPHSLHGPPPGAPLVPGWPATACVEPTRLAHAGARCSDACAGCRWRTQRCISPVHPNTPNPTETLLCAQAGSWLLNLAIGRDCTALFESYHLRPEVRGQRACPAWAGCWPSACCCVCRQRCGASHRRAAPTDTKPLPSCPRSPTAAGGGGAPAHAAAAARLPGGRRAARALPQRLGDLLRHPVRPLERCCSGALDGGEAAAPSVRGVEPATPPAAAPKSAEPAVAGQQAALPLPPSAPFHPLLLASLHTTTHHPRSDRVRRELFGGEEARGAHRSGSEGAAAVILGYAGAAASALLGPPCGLLGPRGCMWVAGRAGARRGPRAERGPPAADPRPPARPTHPPTLSHPTPHACAAAAYAVYASSPGPLSGFLLGLGGAWIGLTVQHCGNHGAPGARGAACLPARLPDAWRLALHSSCPRPSTCQRGLGRQAALLQRPAPADQLSAAAACRCMHPPPPAGAMSTKAWVNNALGLCDDLIGGSSLAWRYHHQVSHHIHCNGARAWAGGFGTAPGWRPAMAGCQRRRQRPGVWPGSAERCPASGGLRWWLRLALAAAARAGGRGSRWRPRCRKPLAGRRRRTGRGRDERLPAAALRPAPGAPLVPRLPAPVHGAPRAPRTRLFGLCCVLARPSGAAARVQSVFLDAIALKHE